MPPGFIDSFSFWTAPTPAWPGTSLPAEPDAASNNSRGATKLAQTAFEINAANMHPPVLSATEHLSTVTKSRSWPFLGNGVVISPNSADAMRRADDERQSAAAASQTEPTNAPPWTKELSLHLMQRSEIGSTSRSRSPSRGGSSGAAEEFSAMAKDDPMPGHRRAHSPDSPGSEAKRTDTSPRQTLCALRRNRSSSDDVADHDDGTGDDNDPDQREGHEKKVPPSERPHAGGVSLPGPSSSAAFDSLTERSSREERGSSGSLSANIRKRNAERAISCGSSDGGRHGDIESIDEAGALWACLSSLTGRVAGAEQRDQARLLSLETTVKAQHARLENYERLQQQQQQLWQQQQRAPATGTKKPARKLPSNAAEPTSASSDGSVATSDQPRTELGDLLKTTTTAASAATAASTTAATSRLSPKSSTFIPPSAVAAIATDGSSSGATGGIVNVNSNGPAVSNSSATKNNANANIHNGGALDPSSAEGLRRVTERVRTLEGRQGALQSKVAALDGVLGRTGAAWAASLKKLAAHTGLLTATAPDAADQTSSNSSSSSNNNINSSGASSNGNSSSSASSNGHKGRVANSNGHSSDGSSSGENKSSDASEVSKAKDGSKAAAADEKMVQVPEALLESLVARITALETALEASRKDGEPSAPADAAAPASD